MPRKYKGTVKGLMSWANAELGHIGRIIAVEDPDIQYNYAMSTVNGMLHLYDALKESIEDPTTTKLAKRDLDRTKGGVERAIRHLIRDFDINIDTITELNTRGVLRSLNEFRDGGNNGGNNGGSNGGNNGATAPRGSHGAVSPGASHGAVAPGASHGAVAPEAAGASGAAVAAGAAVASHGATAARAAGNNYENNFHSNSSSTASGSSGSSGSSGNEYSNGFHSNRSSNASTVSTNLEGRANKANQNRNVTRAHAKLYKSLAATASAANANLERTAAAMPASQSAASNGANNTTLANANAALAAFATAKSGAGAPSRSNYFGSLQVKNSNGRNVSESNAAAAARAVLNEQFRTGESRVPPGTASGATTSAASNNRVSNSAAAPVTAQTRRIKLGEGNGIPNARGALTPKPPINPAQRISRNTSQPSSRGIAFGPKHARGNLPPGAAAPGAAASTAAASASPDPASTAAASQAQRPTLTRGSGARMLADAPASGAGALSPRPLPQLPTEGNPLDGKPTNLHKESAVGNHPLIPKSPKNKKRRYSRNSRTSRMRKNSRNSRNSRFTRKF